MMTWEQKFQALKALGEIALKMRKPGDWYVDHRGVEITRYGSGILSGGYGNGSTPERAVDDHWAKIAGLPVDHYVVLNAMRDDRRQVRWNGFMWEDVQ